jgi:hypothetical protein
MDSLQRLLMNVWKTVTVLMNAFSGENHANTIASIMHIVHISIIIDHHGGRADDF